MKSTNLKFIIKFVLRNCLGNHIIVNKAASSCVVLHCCYATIPGALWFIVYWIWACEQLWWHLKYACFYSTCKKGHVWALSVCAWACLKPSRSSETSWSQRQEPTRLLKMENCSLLSPTRASHSTFVLYTQHLYLPASHAGSKHHQCSSKYSAKCF